MSFGAPARRYSGDATIHIENLRPSGHHQPGAAHKAACSTGRRDAVTRHPSQEALHAWHLQVGSSRPAQQRPAVYRFAAPALLPRLRQRRRPQGGKPVSRWTFAAGRTTALAAFLFTAHTCHRTPAAGLAKAGAVRRRNMTRWVRPPSAEHRARRPQPGAGGDIYFLSSNLWR